MKICFWTKNQLEEQTELVFNDWDKYWIERFSEKS